MTSKRVEDLHKSLVNKILEGSGLECTRSVVESSETSTSSVESEIEGPVEQEETFAESLHEEEVRALSEEVIPEELPRVFPTASLRRVLPDRVRRIEEYNRIHVLPEEFRTDIDPAKIPKIAATPPRQYIDILAELVGCARYRSSLPEYWFLDTLASLLRRAQADEMDRQTQAVLILWFCEWMKEMQHFDAADRKRMLRRFQDNMLAAARFVAVEDHIPTPQEIGVDYKGEGDSGDGVAQPARLKQMVTFVGNGFQCALTDLTLIIHYIYDLFSSDFQYDLVRSVFTFPPDYTLVDAPYRLHNPKRLYSTPKATKKDKSPKKERKEKGRKEVLTEEYLAMMAQKALDDKALGDQIEKDREEWHRRSQILPLSSAAPAALFDKYWPPPPESAPEPPVERGKAGKKDRKKGT